MKKRILSIVIASVMLLATSFAVGASAPNNRINLARPPVPTVSVLANGRARVSYRQVRNANRVQIQWRRVGTQNWRSRTVRHNLARRNVNRNWTIPAALSPGNRYQVRVRALRVQRVNGRVQTTRGAWSRVRNVRIPTATQPPTTTAPPTITQSTTAAPPTTQPPITEPPTTEPPTTPPTTEPPTTQPEVPSTPTADDFELTISVEETTIQQGENFVADVELRNNSGRDLLISYDYLFLPDIPNWNIFDDKQNLPGPPFVMHSMSSLLEADGILRNIETWGFKSGPRSFGATLTPGTHELRFYAWFTLNWGGKDIQFIEVWSSPVTLTVLPNPIPYVPLSTEMEERVRQSYFQWFMEWVSKYNPHFLCPDVKHNVDNVFIYNYINTYSNGMILDIEHKAIPARLPGFTPVVILGYKFVTHGGVSLSFTHSQPRLLLV